MWRCELDSRGIVLDDANRDRIRDIRGEKLTNDELSMDVLAKNGLEADETVDADKFRSRSREGVMGGNAMIRVAFSDPADSFNTFPITTSSLAVSWTDLDGKVEVIAYMS